MPILNIEPNYEHNPIGFAAINGYFEDDDTRKAAYWSVFSGAFGHTYGYSCVWQIWSPKHKPILVAAIPWNQAIFSTASFQMKNLQERRLSRPFLDRIPDQAVIIGSQEYESGYLCGTLDGTLNKVVMIFVSDPFAQNPKFILTNKALLLQVVPM